VQKNKLKNTEQTSCGNCEIDGDFSKC